MSNPSSPELTVKFAAAVLAVRATRARRCGGLVKTAAGDWKENVQTFIGNLKDPGVNLQESFTGPKADLTGAKHWKSVGMEALRNAIIGAGAGGVGGAASSLFSRRRKKQPFRRALHGALLGAGLGAAGTAAYRGLEFPLSGVFSTMEDAKTQAGQKYDIEATKGFKMPDRDTFIREEAARIIKQQQAPSATPTAPTTPTTSTTPTTPTTPAAPPDDSLLDAAERTAKGLGAVGEKYVDRWGEDDYPLREAAGQAGQTITGGHPVGAAAGATAAVFGRPAARVIGDRWNLIRNLHSTAAQAETLPTGSARKLLLDQGKARTRPTWNPATWGRPARRFSYRGQVPGISPETAREAMKTYHAGRAPLKPFGRFGIKGLLAAALGAWGGGQAERYATQSLFGQPQYQPQQ